MKKCILVQMLLLLLMFSCSVPIFATDTSHQEGEIYQGDDGKYYEIINGKSMEIDNGSGSDGSIADVFKGYSKTTKPDSEVMADVRKNITSPIGTLISVIMYLIFAFTGFTTVTDLAYIAIPPIRSILCPANGGNANGYSSYTRESADKAAQRGDMASAASRSWISSELRSLVSNVQTNGQTSQDRNFTATTGTNLMQNKKNLLVEYFKRRAVGIIYTVVILMLLVTTSLFTDLGLNIGQSIYNVVSKFLGF